MHGQIVLYVSTVVLAIATGLSRVRYGAVGRLRGTADMAPRADRRDRAAVLSLIVPALAVVVASCVGVIVWRTTGERSVALAVVLLVLAGVALVGPVVVLARLMRTGRPHAR